jgi:hypothetical protein
MSPIKREPTQKNGKSRVSFRRRPCGHGGPQEVSLPDQPPVGTAAADLAILGWLQLLNPYVILAFVFLIGVGFALNAPALDVEHV